MKELAIRQKLARNTVFNLLGKSWGMLVSLALTPYIIRSVGMEQFGILAVAGAVTGYFYLFDLGVGGSFAKYVAEFHAKKSYKEINEVINTGVAFYILFAAFAFILFLFAAGPVINFLKIPAHLRQEAFVVLGAMLLLFMMQNAFGVFGAVVDGMQRMDISNKVGVAASIVQIAGTFYFLENGFGITGLIINNAIILLVASAAKIAVSFRLIPQLSFRPWAFSISMFGRLANFGLKVQVISLSMLVNNSIVKLLIGHFLNLSAVGFYELGQKIVLLARDIPAWIFNAVVPASSEMEAENNWAGIGELYLRASKYLHLGVVYLMAFIFAAAPLIIRAWTGEEFKDSVLVIRIFAPAYLVNLFTTIGAFIAYGVGRPGIIAKAWVATAVFNLAVSTFLIIKFGFLGALTGGAVSLITGSIIFMSIFNGFIGIRFASFIKITVAKPLAASLCSFAACYPLLNFYLGLGRSSRMIDYAYLCLIAAIFFCVYGVIVFKINYLDRQDLGYIREAVPFLRAKI